MTNRLTRLFSVIAVLLLCVSPTYAGNGQGNDVKTALTKQQILGGLPDGILNTMVQSEWKDNENLYLYKGRGSKSEVFVYNVKKGTTVAAAPVATASIGQDSTEIKLLGKLKEKLGNQVYKKSILKTFSPDKSKIAYIRGNNLYIFSFADGKEYALTTDATNVLMNGYASWVYYEEILGRSSNYKAYWWSPDSKTIAYYRFDDSSISMFPIYNSTGKYGFITETRYPKAGDENPKVEVMFANVENPEALPQKNHVMADFNREDDQYFGIPFWNAEGNRFIIPWMPREQNNLILYTVDPQTGKKEKIYDEKQKSWIDWMEDMHFTQEGFYMVRDFDLWEQIYFQSFDGKRLEKITDGNNWGVNILKVDEKGGYIYFTARREISTRNDVYKVSLKTKQIQRLSEGEYNYVAVSLSDDNKYFTAMRSNSSTPTQLVVASTGKKPAMKVVWDTKGDKFDDYKLAIPQMMYITVEGYKLPAQVIWPVDLDSTKKYPVLVSMYGGPNAGTVMDTWKGVRENTQWWANEGVIQIAIDHRASGHCGKEGLNYLHRNLLNIELDDYIEWMKELHKLPFVNREKVGITGFSYGGSMTVLACTEGNEYFKYGIAGGGVYDWGLYDTHYTERYMDRPQDNPDGYANTRLMEKVAQYKGDKTNYLKITHGTSDDNVHMQNTMQLIEALQNSGKQFDLMIYPGGFHGYRGKQGKHSNMGDYIFWYRHLLEKEAPKVLLEGPIMHR